MSDYEIIIVNDGSRDRARGRLWTAFCRRDAHIRLVNHEVNRGYGAAVWSGIMSSTEDYVFFTDADLQFDLAEISRLLAYVRELDVVVGRARRAAAPPTRAVNRRRWRR